MEYDAVVTPPCPGAEIWRRRKDLVTLNQQTHVNLHKELNKFLMNINRDMVPRKGNPGSLVIQVFGRNNILNTLAQFYKSPVAQNNFKAAADQFFKLHPTLK